MNMRKGDVLVWGIKHIAENHNRQCDTDYENLGFCVCIFGECTVPVLSDVQMLCDCVGIPRENIDVSDFGIDIYMDWDWCQEDGKGQEEYVPTGNELWKRYGAEICS